MYEKVASLKYKYYDLGIALGLQYHELETIKTESGQDTTLGLSRVIHAWLSGRHDRTWRTLVKAVGKPHGGSNHALAKRIANQIDTSTSGLIYDNICS